MDTYVDHNALDDLRLDEMIHQSKLLNQYSNEGQHHFQDFRMLLKDIIFLLYKHALRIEKPLPATVHYEVINHLHDQKELLKLRMRTRGSLSNTYLSLKLILDGLFESVRGRNTLSLLEEVLTSEYEDQLNTYQDLLKDLVLEDFLTEEELSTWSTLMEKFNQGTPMTFNLMEFMTTLINQMQGVVEEDALSQWLKDTMASSKDTHDLQALMESLSDQMDETDASEDGPLTDTDDHFDPKLRNQLEERLTPFLNQQFLTAGDQFDQAKHMTTLTDDTKEEIKAYSNAQVKATDTLLEVKAYALDETSENALRGNSLASSLSHDRLKARSAYYRSEVNQLMKRLKLPRILKKTLETVDAFNETTRTLGIDQKSMNHLDFDEIIQLYRRYKKPEFVRFVNKVGKNKLHASIMQHQKKQRHAIPIDRVTNSNKIDLLIEDEFIGLALDVEAFENDFYDRYLRDDLMTLEMIEKHDRQKGPIILCYDGSGSMEGVKIEETQSHILAIMEIAKIQKRHMVIIQFAAASEPLYIKEINPKYITAQDVTDILDTFICGGTNFEKPLSKAMEYIKKDQHRKSDILFITDGQCEIHQKFKDDFLRVKAQRDFKLYTLIMHSYTYHDYGDIGDISDEIMEIQEQDFNNWNTATNDRLYSLI